MASKFSLRSLFGGKGGESAPPEPGPATDYKGFAIRPAPRREGDQWRVAGVITKELEGETREHHFIRAETLSSQDEAAKFSVVKGRQIVDDFGDRMFDQAR